jgi:hypothetical protein
MREFSGAAAVVFQPYNAPYLEEMNASTRDWLNWTATVLALIGIAAGYASVNVSFDPSATAENYAAQRTRLEYLGMAVTLVAIGAPVVALAIGIIARGFIGTLSGALASAFVVIVVPSHLRACCGGDESSVISLLRSINSSQQAYASSCARDKYAMTLETLTKPPLQGGTPFIFAGADRGSWRGYAVTMQAGAPVDVETCNGARVGTSSYFVEAHPIDAGAGRRSFATDQRGTVYQNTDGKVIQPGMAGAEPIQ